MIPATTSVRLPAFLLLACLSAGSAFAQNDTARPLSGWIPAGWKQLRSAGGRLNSDTLPDLVLVVESNRQQTYSAPNAGTWKAYPRRLLVLFGAGGGRYTLHHGSNTLVPYPTGRWEPLEELVIEAPGKLMLGFGQQYPRDSEYGQHVTYRFRFEDGRLRLTGAEYLGNTGGTWSYVAYSYNFLTGRRSRQATMVTDNGDEKPGPETWKRFSNPKPLFLEQMKYPFARPMQGDDISL